MNDDNGNAKIKLDGTLNPYKGDFTINILELLKELDEETRTELMLDGGWWSIITDNMAERIVNEFSRESYNEIYTRLREKILNSESMPQLIRDWAESMIESRERAKEKELYWDRAYWNLKNWICQKNEYFYKEIPYLPDQSYGKKYSPELMKEVEEKLVEWKKLFPDPKKEE